MSDSENVNTAPFPVELARLVESVRYKNGWTVRLRSIDRGQRSVGLTLVIKCCVRDSYAQEDGRSVLHYFPVPPAAYDRRSWQRWLFDCFLLVERHECMEFFMIDGKRPYAPSHGPGNDPYMIRERGTDEDARARAL